MTPTATDTHAESGWTTVTGTLAVLTGVGTLILALAPLSIPFLILTVAFIAPFGLLGILVLPVALFALVVRAGRRVLSTRSARSRQGPRRVHASSPGG